MKAWLWYAGSGLVVTLLLGVCATLLVARESVDAIWFAAGVAYALQLVSFAALVAVRGRNEWFLAGWLAGMVARFATVLLVAYWLSRSAALPQAPALISLVAFLFVLLLLEPLFLRRGLQTR
ncbi:MAG TPA: hypothetical protein VMN60_10105 [Longimicrobiales bacterium]|nr:hypothetical protein [Longimicrobiales bacterium]